MPSHQETKAQAQARFGQHGQGYVESHSHAAGADLERLLARAAPQRDGLALDIATGGGHTALKLAPHVQQMVALDLTPKMLAAARVFIAAQGVQNVAFATGDAEQLPFRSASFDLVTCRIAPHHFPDCFRFVQESARVLKAGGRLVLEDHLLPDDERAARYIDSFERLRDPSHFRAFADYEWQGMLLDAGLTVEQSEKQTKPGTKLLPWAARQGCTPAVIARLQVMLAQAPSAVADWMRPTCAGRPDASFDQHFILIAGKKEA